MALKKNLILVASDKMDSNKKESRNENSLIRMSAATRNNMHFNDDSVELWDNSSSETRINSAVILSIFKAFSNDVKKVKEMISKGDLKPADIDSIGFVTSKIYQSITGKPAGTPKKNIWISDTIEDTVIGTDPEFLLFNKDGSIKRANDVQGFSYTGQLGYDGAMAEMRPKPATTPSGIVDNIYSILTDKALVKPIENFTWKSGCYYKDDTRDYPIGGHIHIGNPAKVAGMGSDKRSSLFIVMNKILDELLAVPMARFDGDRGNKRRTKCTMGKYGYFGEWRTCNGRLEHRTLSGMWLSHPELMEAVFGTAKAIIDEVFRRVSHNKYSYEYIMPSKLRNMSYWKNDFNSWKDIPLAKDLRSTRSSPFMNEVLNSCCTRKINKPFLKEWLSNMKSLSTYNQYSEHILKLSMFLNAPVKTIHSIDTNIQRNWLEKKKFELL